MLSEKCPSQYAAILGVKKNNEITFNEAQFCTGIEAAPVWDWFH